MQLALVYGLPELADRGVDFKTFLDDVIRAALQEIEGGQLRDRFTLAGHVHLIRTVFQRVSARSLIAGLVRPRANELSHWPYFGHARSDDTFEDIFGVGFLMLRCADRLDF